MVVVRPHLDDLIGPSLSDAMVSFLNGSNKARYINLLTDFGFKRLFGTEPNKALLIDFLNVVLPEKHRVKDLSYRNSENVGNTPVDRRAIVDINCESESGEQLIIELQKAQQNYFKDWIIYHSIFPIQEQAKQGEWDYKFSPVYVISLLDFVFDDHPYDPSILHRLELQDQDGKVFYDKLQFIYLELPKFRKSVDQLSDHFEKWLFLLKHLSDLEDRPQALQEGIFSRLFDVAELANFSSEERDAYENSLKYYRDLKNVVDTSRDEGREEGREEGRQEERLVLLQRQRSFILDLLERKLGTLPETVQLSVSQLSFDRLEDLGRAIFEFDDLAALSSWLEENN